MQEAADKSLYVDGGSQEFELVRRSEFDPCGVMNPFSTRPSWFALPQWPVIGSKQISRLQTALVSGYFPDRIVAVDDFKRARCRAALQSIVSHLTGKSSELLSYEEVRQKLRGRENSTHKLEDIPLEAIIGSVGRYKDFTRDFLPRKNVASDRWIRVKLAMIDSSGVPPIEVYRIGEFYFVLDGYHRVSVAREMGLTHLEAYVTVVATRGSLSPDAQPDDLIVQAEFIDFLERTKQHELRPEAELRLTESGRYPVLVEHIDVHRYYLGLECACEIPYETAFTSWYDNVYTPVVEVVRACGLLRDFPERTETDLYLWISQHRAELERTLGWQISTDNTARDLKSKQESERPAKERLLNELTRDENAARLPPPTEPPAQTSPRRESRVVEDLLVVVDGKDSGWRALDQALEVARREDARVLGLHVAPTSADHSNDKREALEARFDQRCRDAGIAGQIAIDVGKTAETICKRARWSDLVVTSFAPPATGGLRTRLGSQFRNLIRSCPRPVLVVPAASTALQSALLAYDGGSKSEEALYVASYLASRWSLDLTVVTVSDSVSRASKIQTLARSYLEQHGIQAEMVALGKAPVAQTILHTADSRASDMILMGGYGLSPMVEAVLGNAVDEVLRKSKRPVLVLT